VDEISQEPRRDFRLPLPPGPRRWLILIGVAGLVAAITVVGVNRPGGRHVAGGSSRPTAAQSPDAQSVIVASLGSTRTPTLEPIETVPPAGAGTALLTCESVVSSRHPNWQVGSLRIGSLWLVGGRQQGYVRLGRTQQAPSGHGGISGVSLYVQMLVHVDPGSPVVMRAAAGTRPYFEFLDSPATTGDYQGPDGGAGYTFFPCSVAGPASGNGVTDFYEVGFSIVPGHTAAVEVWTSPSARPVWLTFTAPAG
jgi:hypothetical protein